LRLPPPEGGSTHLALRPLRGRLEERGVVKPLEEISDLGRRYAGLADCQEKEDLLLEICQCFHPYLMKYLVMICCGRVPIVGHGSNPCYTNKDVKPFLLYFLPKGQKPTRRP